MHACLMPRQPAPVLARGATRLRRCLGPNAFGNALGESIAGANGQSSRSDDLDAFLALNDNFSGSSYTFADSMAGRRVGNNPMGLPTYSDGAAVSAGDAAASGGKGITQIVAELSRPRAYTAQSRDTISSILGTSDPRAIGNFMRANGLRSSTIYAGQDYVIPGAINALGDNSALGQNALNNDNARLQAIVDAQRAQAATSINTGAYPNMDPRDFQGSFGYQSMIARQLSDASAGSAGPTYTDSIKPAQSGVDNIRGAVGAYLNRSDVSLSQAISAAWNGGGNDLLAGVGHSLGAGGAAVGAAFTSPTVLGTVGLGLLSVQQTDAAVADYRRFFGSGDERGAQSLLTQGLTPVIGSGGAAYVTGGIDFAYGVGAMGSGLSRAESRVSNNTTYRALNPNDAQTWEAGQGLTAKAPDGQWTAEQHVLNAGPQPGGAMLNDSWIASTRRYDVANTSLANGGYNSGNGVVSINLGRVPTEQVEVWQNVARSNAVDSLAYHRSIWAQEVSIYQNVPARAIGTPFAPMSQVPAYGPISYGLAIGSSVFTGRQGSQR
ncbi:LysM peptidoglycan-binding domain-containing protein [Variovorax paradoxus]|uniref:LysM peptidoglycan-binding domain-containing protein n=1 Tax=Variovorax paradoxus TaxID=34073 RepID=UPI00278332F9|nr:LysM peptidoglycan-binding domain-containing protein [Variovorax paradoxus]MDP9933638.1 hypothetical protein [Variovorax paradoxus]